jgi:hypothetical protein
MRHDVGGHANQTMRLVSRFQMGVAMSQNRGRKHKNGQDGQESPYPAAGELVHSMVSPAKTLTSARSDVNKL